MNRLALVLALALGSSALAGEKSPPPPSRMDLVDAARMDAAMAHLQKLQADEKPYFDLVAKLCAKWGIPMQALFSGAVSVDFQTGAIGRPPPPAAPAPAPSPKK